MLSLYKRAEYTEADTTRIDVLDTSGVPVGFVDFTKEFKSSQVKLLISNRRI